MGTYRAQAGGYGGGGQGYGQQPGGYGGGPGQPPGGGGPGGQPGWGQQPQKRRNTGLIVGAIVAAVLLVGGGVAAFLLLGGDGGEKEYVTDVCTQLDDFQNRLSSLGEELQNADAATIDEAKQIIDEKFGEATAEADDFVAEITALEPPDVEGAQEFEDALVNMANEIKAVIEEAQAQLASVPSDDPTSLVNVLTSFATEMQTRATEAGDAVQEVDAPALQDAGEEVEECESL